MIDPKDFKLRSNEIIQWIDHYLNQISSLPVKSQVGPGEIYDKIPVQAPKHSEPLEEIMDDLNEIIRPQWRWVKGHSGDELNELCDSLVQKAIATVESS